MRITRPTLLAAATLVVASIPAHVTPAPVVAPAPDVVRLHVGATHAGAVTAQPLTTAQCQQQDKIACYGPAQLQHAYDLAPLYAQGDQGQGQTIAIVDSFGSPTIAADLDVFDTAYGLPKPNLTIITPAGAIPAYDNSDTRSGWAGETNLDVEWAHAMAPQANILLVETPTSEDEGVSGFPEIETAEKYVIDHGMASVISQSFSATEQTFPSPAALLALRGAYQDAAQKGVTVLTASGDAGATDSTVDGAMYPQAVTSWPDSDPLVTGVGGTKLTLDATGDRTMPDTVWNDTYDKATQRYIVGNNGPNPLAAGGGLSTVFSRPGYQSSVAAVVGNQRGVPDISMSAACNGAVNVYQSFGGQPAGWYPTCGTSEATPLFAGVIALAVQAAGHPLGQLNPALYAMSLAHVPGIVDITTGNNSVSYVQNGTVHNVTGFAAGPGYDLASGLGTVDAALFVPELISFTAKPSA